MLDTVLLYDVEDPAEDNHNLVAMDISDDEDDSDDEEQGEDYVMDADEYEGRYLAGGDNDDGELSGDGDEESDEEELDAEFAGDGVAHTQ